MIDQLRQGLLKPSDLPPLELVAQIDGELNSLTQLSPRSEEKLRGLRVSVTTAAAVAVAAAAAVAT